MGTGAVNPLDMVFQAVHRHVGTTGRDVRTECLMHDLASRGFTEGMLREAIENWVSPRVVALQGCEVTLDPTTLSLPPPANMPQAGDGASRT
eukprot:11188381-Lingulodinium_polyedra.AAC.1